jgi:hypothetical protein
LANLRRATRARENLMSINFTAVVSELKNILTEIEREFFKIKYNSINPQHLYSMMLSGTIFELCKSCLFLLENSHYSGIPILLRSISESLFDLEIILNNDDSYNHFLAKHYSEKIKQLKKLKLDYDPNTPHDALISKQLDDYCLCLKKLDQMGFKSLTAKDKINKCMTSKTNKILYNLFCSDTHSDLSALEKRHLNQDDNGNVEIVYFNTTDDIHIISYIDGIFMSSLHTIELLSTKFNEICRTNINLFAKKYHEINSLFSEISRELVPIAPLD